MAREKVIDLSKASAELSRMVDGEIPFNVEYIKELIEYDDNLFADVSFDLVCENCGLLAAWEDCPECEIAPNNECGLCGNIGGWFACEQCDKDELNG